MWNLMLGMDGLHGLASGFCPPVSLCLFPVLSVSVVLPLCTSQTLSFLLALLFFFFSSIFLIVVRSYWLCFSFSVHFGQLCKEAGCHARLNIVKGSRPSLTQPMWGPGRLEQAPSGTLSAEGGQYCCPAVVRCREGM